VSGGHRFGGGVTAGDLARREFNLYDCIVGSMQVDIMRRWKTTQTASSMPWPRCSTAPLRLVAIRSRLSEQGDRSWRMR
jgi:hypothetical protein